MHPLTLFLQKNLFYLLLAVLALNLFQRRYQKASERKRFATAAKRVAAEFSTFLGYSAS